MRRKKQFDGVRMRSAEAGVFERTPGAWLRKEPPQRTVAKARKAFRKSMGRHAR